MKMTIGKPPVQAKSGNLLAMLLDNPQLPAYIARLNGPTLSRLVQHVGKEDAQELLAFATPEQITDLIETDTWDSASPGAEETFSPEKFLEWLEIWSDMGPAVLAKQLQNLGSQIFALTLSNYVVVVDTDEVGVSGPVERFDRFGVMPEDEESWPLILQFLGEIWDEEPAYLEEALAYCCLRRSLTVEKTHITANEALAPDVAGNRDRHRRERGHVTPTSSLAFLQGIRTRSLQSLLLGNQYDPFKAMQINQQERMTGTSKPPQEKTSSPAMKQSQHADPADDTGAQLAELAILLEPILGTSPEAQQLLLSGPAAKSGLYLDEQLHKLAMRNADAMERRCNEIIYLANVLVEGTSLQGKRLTETEATRCVSLTCNLGLMYCVFESPWDEEDVLLSELLETDPGLIKIFAIGFRLIVELPEKVRSALHRALLAPTLQRRLRQYPWIKQMVLDEVNTEQIQWQASGSHKRNLDKLLDSLLFLCDASTCEQLRIVGDALPRFPTALDPSAQPGIHVDKSWRFIASPEELRRLLHWLDNLENFLLRN